MRNKITLFLSILFIAMCLCSCGKSSNTEDNENTDMMSEKEILSFLENERGVIINDYCSELKGLTQNKYSFVECKIKPDSKDKFYSYIKSEFGDGISPDTISMPKFKNQICDALNKKNVKMVYEIMQQGDNGAKTKSFEMFIAEDENEGLYLYIF